MRGRLVMCVAIPRIAGLACRSWYGCVRMLYHGWSSCHPAGAQRTGCARKQALSGWRWRVRGVLAEEVLQGVLPRGCPGTRWGHARWSRARLQGPSTASDSALRLQRVVHYLGGRGAERRESIAQLVSNDELSCSACVQTNAVRPVD